MSECGTPFITVVEALIQNPNRYAIIFAGTKYDDDNNEYHEGLLQVASSFLMILSSQIVDKTMIAAAVKGEGSYCSWVQMVPN